MTRLTWKTLSLLLLLCTAAPSFAADSATDSLRLRTLDDYLRLARAANADLGAASYRAAAARERIDVADALPDPTLMYGYHVRPERIQGRQELELFQQFPFFGKRGMRRDIAERDASVELNVADATALDVEFEVKAAFYRYVGLSETTRVLENESELLRRMRDVAQIRYSSGASEQQEVLKIELSLSRLADETTLNRRELVATRARLNELIGRHATAVLPAPEWTTPDLAAIDAMAVPDSARARRPEVAMARAEIERAEAARRLAKREYVPDFMLGVKYEFGAGEDDLWEVMAGINLPIWIGKRRAMVREAEAMRQSAEYGLEAATLRTNREVEAAAERARAARERFERYQNAILPQAEAAFESSEAGYRTGRVNFLDYLDSERTLLEMRREYAMVIADLGMQMAALERAVASSVRE